MKTQTSDPSSLTLDPSSFCIVGAGGIGCAVGYALASSGLRPTLVDANPEKIRWGNANGLVLDRRPQRPATLIHFDDWQPKPGTTVLLCTKCYDNATVLARLPYDVRLLPIQNGFDADLLSRLEDIEGIASFVSECHPERTHTRLTRQGFLHLGLHHGIGSDPTKALLKNLASLLRHGPFRVRLVNNILPYKYTKLMYNAAISPLAAVAGLDNGQLLSVAPARRLFFALLQENYDILAGAGIELDRIGPFHPRTVQRILRRPALANLAALFFYPTLRGSYCSMSGDLPRGRTEIDYYNRHLIDIAGKHNISCPLNKSVYALVKSMEQDRELPAVERLSRLGAAA